MLFIRSLVNSVIFYKFLISSSYCHIYVLLYIILMTHSVITDERGQAFNNCLKTRLKICNSSWPLFTLSTYLYFAQFWRTWFLIVNSVIIHSSIKFRLDLNYLWIIDARSFVVLDLLNVHCTIRLQWASKPYAVYIVQYLCMQAVIVEHKFLMKPIR